MALAAVLTLACAACGGGSGSPDVASAGNDPEKTSSASAAPTGSRQDQLVAFAGCMRENGVEIPDPAPGEENVQLPAGTKGDSRTQAALAECQRLLGGGAKDGTDSTAQDRAVELAECLRGKGLDVADPEPGKPLQLSGAAGSPEAREAITACRSAVGAGAGTASPSAGG
ncbi:hypothetical protein OG230_27505 [Streptomyces sp. NBC_00234]|uniref:hypothetical protein n=1 Tax=Streptomyces sp. NBC_00234 TaxID=2903638 RepID=UPI002E2847FB|nr:hypothetical protein [Streptomyces sp. NBC_00234]